MNALKQYPSNLLCPHLFATSYSIFSRIIILFEIILKIEKTLWLSWWNCFTLAEFENFSRLVEKLYKCISCWDCLIFNLCSSPVFSNRHLSSLLFLLIRLHSLCSFYFTTFFWHLHQILKMGLRVLIPNFFVMMLFRLSCLLGNIITNP